MTDLAKKIVDIQKRNNLNTNQLSKRLGLADGTLSKLINGVTKDPRISIIRKMSESFQLNPYELYELITGEIYTEHPKGSIKEEMKYLEKENESLKSQLEESKNREDRYLKILENFSLSQKLTPHTSKGTGELGSHIRKIKPKIDSKAPG